MECRWARAAVRAARELFSAHHRRRRVDVVLPARLRHVRVCLAGRRPQYAQRCHRSPEGIDLSPYGPRRLLCRFHGRWTHVAGGRSLSNNHGADPGLDGYAPDEHSGSSGQTPHARVHRRRECQREAANGDGRGRARDHVLDRRGREALQDHGPRRCRDAIRL